MGHERDAGRCAGLLSPGHFDRRNIYRQVSRQNNLSQCPKLLDHGSCDGGEDLAPETTGKELASGYGGAGLIARKRGCAIKGESRR